MEENIKILEKEIKTSREIFEEVGVNTYFSESIMKIVENLIKGYRGKEEENEKLKGLAGKQLWISSYYVAENYIPKSKIKEKAEEIDKRIPKAQGEELLILEAKKDFAQELLEE